MKKNIKAIVLGLIALLAFFLAFSMSYEDMYIRNNGQVIKAPVVEIYSRRWMTWIHVEINGQKLAAGEITTGQNPSLGDSIEVCYISGKANVVQKNMDPNRYYLFFGLESLLLFFGLYLIIAGLIGDKVPEKKTFIKTTKKERRKNK